MLARLSICATFLLFTPSLHAWQWDEWHVIGPFDHPKSFADMSVAHAPESNLRELALNGPGIELEEREKGKGGKWIAWSKLRGAQADNVELHVGKIDLNVTVPALEGVEKWNQNAAAYLYRRCVADEDATLALQLGSDDGVRLWWNGELLLDRAIGRGFNISDDFVQLPVRKGTNHLLVKVVNGGGGWGFGMAAWDRVPQSDIDAAINAGVAYLLEHQLLDGSWGGHPGYVSGQTAYTVYCLLKCGLSWQHPAVQRGMAWVRARPTDFTYSITCELLAALEMEHASHGAAGLRSWIEERLEVLIDIQGSSGLWAYPVHPNGNYLADDLSNTLFAALVLRAALQQEFEIPTRTWKRMLEATLSCVQNGAARRDQDPAPPAAIGYHPGGGMRGSTTTAGISVLEICAKALEGNLSTQHRDRIAGARLSGLAWIAKNMTWAKNPGGSHHYFWIYGIERVGGLLGLKSIGGLDWYWTGAEYLLEKQKDNGSWAADHADIDTILALLFLKRATVPTTGRKEDPMAETWTADGPEAEVALRASGDTPMSLFVIGFPAEVRERFEWAGEEGRGLRIERVDFLARPAEGQAQLVSIGSAEGDPEAPAGTRRFATQHSFPHNGKWIVVARVHALSPDRTDKDSTGLVVIESPELEVTVAQVLDLELLEYATAESRNLLRASRVKAEASSHHGEQKAEKAFDGLVSTRWHSGLDDEQPWLELVCPRAVRADQVLLTHAWPRATHPNAPRPKTVELVINGKQSFTVEMDPDPLKKTLVELGEALRVRKLLLTIVDSRDRTLGTDAVGFAEVELRMGE